MPKSNCGGVGQPPCPPIDTSKPIEVPHIPGTHPAPIDGGAPERDIPKPKGDDGDAKKYQDADERE